MEASVSEEHRRLWDAIDNHTHDEGHAAGQPTAAGYGTAMERRAVSIIVLLSLLLLWLL